jgi:hypothetical protein
VLNPSPVSLAFLPDGRPAMTYVENLNAGLIYAEFDGTAWQRTALDPELRYRRGASSLAIGPAGPAVCYENFDEYTPWAGLFYAARQGSTWTRTPLASGYVGDGVCSLAFHPTTGQPCIAYSLHATDWLHAALIYFTYDGSAWQQERAATIQAMYGGAGYTSLSLKFRPSGEPVIGRTMYESELMHESSWAGWQTRAAGSWSGENLEGGYDAYCYGASLGMLPTGDPVLSYAFNWHLHYGPPATTVDPNSGVATSLAILPSGEPAIAYSSPGGVRYVWRNGPTWNGMTVYPDPNVPRGNVLSLALRPLTNQPAIAYFNGSQQVNFAIAFFRGDLNCDGSINFDDIGPFVLSLTDPAGYASSYPDCSIINADLNEDGRADFEDISPFVAALSG